MTIVEPLFIAMWVSNGSQLAMGIAYIKNNDTLEVVEGPPIAWDGWRNGKMVGNRIHAKVGLDHCRWPWLGWQ